MGKIRFVLVLFLVLVAVTPVSAGMKSAGLKVAVKAFERGDYAAALPELEKLAGKGNPTAQRILAAMYEGGLGVQRNYREAFEWYHLAAEKNDLAAQFMVAQMYYQGKGGPVDYAEAAKWYRSAAEKGHGYAQYNLALMYEYGRGVPVDKRESLKWHLEAAKGDLAESQYRIAKFCLDGEPGPRELPVAFFWLDRAARSGSEEAKQARHRLAATMTPAQVQRAKGLGKAAEDLDFILGKGCRYARQ